MYIYIYIQLNIYYRPVYEYPLNGHWLMIDSDNSYILWTSIWKGISVVSLLLHPDRHKNLFFSALGNSKADIVKIVEAQPEIASQLRRVRGGYLKIQGTWMPYEVGVSDYLFLAYICSWTSFCEIDCFSTSKKVCAPPFALCFRSVFFGSCSVSTKNKHFRVAWPIKEDLIPLFG